MKKILSIFVTMIIFLSSANSLVLSYGEEWDGYESASPVEFTDVNMEHWAYESIMEVYRKSWFKGYPDGTFRPNNSISRAEALKVFVVFMGLDYYNVDLSEMTYYDVDSDEWYAPYIEAGKDLFPVHRNIQGKTPFNPNMPVTREDTIYALVKALGCDAKVKYPDLSVLNLFKDKSSISSSLMDTFAVALEHELVSGFPDSTIRAQAPLTRAEFATLLLRGTQHGTHDDAYDAKIDTITVKPESSVSIEIGESVSLTAKAKYTDGTVKDYDEFDPYIDSGDNVVSLTGNELKGKKEGTAVIKFNDSKLKNKKLTVTVTKPDDAPVIKITGYEEKTENESVNFSISVRDSSGYVDLECNGIDINMNGTTAEFRANLEEGENTFEFKAVNEYGNTSTKTIRITRISNKPSLVEMINVVGKAETDAKEILSSMGINVITETAWSEEARPGIVLNQSVKSGELIEIGKSVKLTVSGGRNDWIGWVDTLPSYVDETSYVIEEKTQYKHRKYETTSGNVPNKAGWELINQVEHWGEWSNWSTTRADSSATRDVRTRDVANEKQYKTQWNYTRYYGWNPSKNAYVSWPWQGDYSRQYQERGWSDSPLENRGKADNVNATVYKDPYDSINIWWWNETTRRVELPQTYHTEYQYRDKTIVYYFTRWTEWSDWSDQPVYENSETDVQTRTVFRYKFK